MTDAGAPPIDAIDRRLIRATQAGLPLVPRPYARLAEELGIETDEVLARTRRLLALGVIRRIGVVPNHYRLGYVANGMSVWDIADDQVSVAGREIGALPFVSHCYHRPRHVPLWPYNLFAMVHGKSRAEVMAQVEEIARRLDGRAARHEVLFSTRILKKTGLRLVD